MPLSAISYVEAVSAAQGMMATVRPDLRIDGKWGKYSQSVFESLDPELRGRIGKMVAVVAHGATVTDLANYRSIERQAEATPAAVQLAIGKASAESGIPVTTLTAFAKIESRLNPLAKNGSSQGLMQMQPRAWKDASTIVKLPSYEQGVWSPLENARAGAAYIQFNKRVLDKIGYKGPWDAAHMYLAHQQGAGGLNAMYKAAHGSPAALAVENMKGNPPQDGKGVTTDPIQFYKRWIEVVNRKLS